MPARGGAPNNTGGAAAILESRPARDAFLRSQPIMDGRRRRLLWCRQRGRMMRPAGRTALAERGLRKGLTSYGDAEFSLFLRKAFIKAMGYLRRRARPPHRRHHRHRQRLQPLPRQRARPDRGGQARRHARRRPADGVPHHLHPRSPSPTPPACSCATSWRMDTEEMIRAQPMDAVVLIGGCDKTLPAQMMAAVSADLPAIVLPVGPMLVGHHKGEVLGACTDCRRLLGCLSRRHHRRGRNRGRVSGRLAPTVGHLHGHGHGQHHGAAWPRRSASRCPAALDSRHRTPSACAPPRRRAPAAEMAAHRAVRGRATS